MEGKWTKESKDGYVIIHNPGGKDLGLAKDTRVQLITEDGLAFKDFWERVSWRPMRTGDFPQRNGQRTWQPGFP